MKEIPQNSLMHKENSLLFQVGYCLVLFLLACGSHCYFVYYIRPPSMQQRRNSKVVFKPLIDPFYEL